jgi:WD40 repeat protein
MYSLKAHHTEINDVIFSRASSVLYTGSSDGSAKVWRSHSGTASATLRGGGVRLLLRRHTLCLRSDRCAREGDPVVSVAENPTRHLLAGASTDRSIRLWDVSTERLVQHLTGHSNKVVSPSTTERAVCLTARSACRKKVHAVCFSADGKLLISGSTDRTIKVWDVQAGKAIRNIYANYTCNALDITRDSNVVVSGHQVMVASRSICLCRCEESRAAPGRQCASVGRGERIESARRESSPQSSDQCVLFAARWHAGARGCRPVPAFLTCTAPCRY